MNSGSEDSRSGEMPEGLAELIQAGGGILRFDEFMQYVLYHPELGYYRAPRKRVGRDRKADFYTAQSLGQVFSRMVLAAIRQLAGDSLDEFVFVELGPESENGILDGMTSHPFQDYLQIRPGQGPVIPPRSIVFSNEVWDAQPFRRFIRNSGKWRELGVVLGTDSLDWDLLDPSGNLPSLPEDLPEGYLVDWPSGAHSLLESIARQPWSGWFIAFDYGLPRSVVLQERPGGTARTYFAHQMGTNLLANPGNTDITCHLIWNELEAILQAAGFTSLRLESQEAFFMHHSQPEIERIITSSPAGFSIEKQTLMELLHPENMGRKFQVLYGYRGES